jgi:hypothetical protein
MTRIHTSLKDKRRAQGPKLTHLPSECQEGPTARLEEGPDNVPVVVCSFVITGSDFVTIQCGTNLGSPVVLYLTRLQSIYDERHSSLRDGWTGFEQW